MDNILDRPESSGVCNLTFQLQENDTVHNCTENNCINTIYSEDSYEIEIGREIITEALPRLQNYRYSRGPSKRPSLGTLHGQHDSVKDKLKNNTDLTPRATFQHTIKLGWIQGVLIPCLLNIWGVMLFLRLSWVVAEAGIGLSLVIIAISAVVCVITTLSLSALCSNGEVKGGGIYYIISRSLGPEFGASVGIVFAFANAVSASMNTIGFCNSLSDLLGNYYIIDRGGQNDARIIGTAATLVMILICAVGMDWESKVQNVLIITIVGAMLDFILGTLLGPRYQEQEARGFVGFSTKTFSENWGPMWRPVDDVTYDFFQVFAIFFPSVTGIQAGANISGDLKDPSSAIPKGTFLSLLISMTSYALFVIFAGGAALRDASGNTTDLRNISFCADSRSCKYGLFNSYQMMQIMSLWGPLIYAGCFAATLSTALTNLLSVPRLIQALGNDKIYPGLKYFSKGYGKYGEPYRGYVLTFFVSVAFLLIADLNAIAPLISNFYLASYALINFCTFHAALVKPLGWRPDFKFYSTWLSLFGFIICIAIMFLINWWASIITFILILGLYLVVVYRNPDVNWGSSTQAQIYKTALSGVIKLMNIEDHVKNYKPQILLLCGNPKCRPMLVKYANLITKNSSLLIVADVEEQKLSHRKRSTRISNAYQYLKDNKIKAFYNIIDNVSYEIGIPALLEVAGLGNLKPNVLMIGYKRNWNVCSEQELNSYFNIFHIAFEHHVSVIIIRLNDGFKSTHNRKLIAEDKSNIKEEGNSNMCSKTNTPTTTNEIGSSNVILNSINTEGAKNKVGLSRESDAGDLPLKSNLQVTENSTILKEITLKRKPKKGSIDVWWLYDDGGLTMLISYIISKRSNWSNCNLRIFALVANKSDSEMEEKCMTELLSRFRLDYCSLKMVSLLDRPQDKTVKSFEDLFSSFKDSSGSGCQAKSEFITLQDNTLRQLRLRELLLEHSSNADLIVMSLPMPRKGVVSASLYMIWLEILTKDMPAYLLVRGNQQSVLTVYS